jgi:nucleoside-diphosphate kinase
MSMVTQRTLSILKPDAVARNITGLINQRFEQAGLRIVAQKRIKVSFDEAARFYAEHKERSFFQELCDYMSSGPVIVQVLEGDNAVAKNRELMGHTDPAKADVGTIRKDFGESIGANTVHGSDAQDSAEREIRFFFSESEMISS